MTDLGSLGIWFVTGTQPLYGQEALAQVAADPQKIAESLGAETSVPYRLVFKPVLTTAEEVRSLRREANNAERRIGLVLWMHTFSPAKMGIAGLSSLTRPFLHLHIPVQPRASWIS